MQIFHERITCAYKYANFYKSSGYFRVPIYSSEAIPALICDFLLEVWTFAYVSRYSPNIFFFFFFFFFFFSAFMGEFLSEAWVLHN